MASIDDYYDEKGMLKGQAPATQPQAQTQMPTQRRRQPPQVDPRGGLWYETGRDMEGPESSQDTGGIATLVHGLRTAGNDFTRGFLRTPNAIISGVPTLAADVLQELASGFQKPWNETLKASDWIPEVLRPEGVDKGLGEKGLGLYSTQEPTDWRRYVGRPAEFIGGSMFAPGATSYPALAGSVAGGVGSQIGSDVFPGSKIAPVVGGLLGALGGAAAGTRAFPAPAASATPSVAGMRAEVQRELNDPNITQFSPEVQRMQNRLDQMRSVDRTIQDVRDAQLRGDRAIGAVQGGLGDYLPAPRGAPRPVPHGGPLEQPAMDQLGRVTAAASTPAVASRLLNPVVTGAARLGIGRMFGSDALALLDTVISAGSQAMGRGARTISQHAAAIRELQKLRDVIRTGANLPGKTPMLNRVPGLLGTFEQGQVPGPDWRGM